MENDAAAVVNTMRDENIEDIVGFSIGQEQLRMKSPDTPAIEKVRALDQFKDNFDLGPKEADFDEGDACPETYHDHPNTLHDALDGNISESPGRQHSPLRVSPEDASRSSTSRSIIRDRFEPRTRRASSESTGMVGALRKLLPDLSSTSLKASGLPNFGFGLKSMQGNQHNRPKRSNTLFSSGNLPWRSSAQSPDRVIVTREVIGSQVRESDRSSVSSRSGVHQSNIIAPWTTPNSQILRRATSDQSLFIRNDLETVTTQDDAEKWANISEQINSRFKAITDSFQDSAMTRIPRMPKVGLGSLTSGLPRNNSDTARGNKHRNVGTELDATTKQLSSLKIPTPLPAKQTGHTHPVLNQAVSDLTGDIVVLGGYRGSVLRSARPPNKQLWVPVKVRKASTNLQFPMLQSLTENRVSRLA